MYALGRFLGGLLKWTAIALTSVALISIAIAIGPLWIIAILLVLILMSQN